MKASRPVRWELLLIDWSGISSPHLHFQVVRCTALGSFLVLEGQKSMLMLADYLMKKIQDKKSRAHKSAVKLSTTANIHNIKYEQEKSLPLVLASFISLFILSKTPTVLLHLFKAVSSSKCWSRTDWYAVTIFSGIPPTVSFYSKSQQIRRCPNIQPNMLDTRRRISNLLLLSYQNPSVKLWNLKGD